MNELGPLEPLIGVWEGGQGLDIAPISDHGSAKETRYREEITFTPIGLVANGPQLLYGLRYTTIAWPLNESEPFHEEVGYWLWDGREQQIMRSFVVPRGVVVNAGGNALADSRKFQMSAEVGSEVYGILSNPFLDRAFKTVRYDLAVEILTDDRFSYSEDTVLKMANTTDLFHHVDSNKLSKQT